MTDMTVSLCGVTLKNPVMTASGTFGFGREYGKFFPLSELGAVCTKGLTFMPREGNPPPRIAETPMGALNSVGLQNPGVEYFIRNELPELRRHDTKIIANICGNTVDEYAAIAERLETLCDMLEVNISCPNVKEGGMAFGTTCVGAAEVTEAVKKKARVPVIVKLSPNVGDISEIARAAEAAGADALSLINTVLGMKIDVNTRRPVLFRNVGGLSGPAVLPIAVRMVWQAANAVRIPIIGMGGVRTASDALELMMAGASAVAVGTAMFADAYAPVAVRDGIAEYMEKNGIRSAAGITGSVTAN